MPTSIDSLQIEINAKSVSANDALDKLISKLDRLTSSLEKVNGSAINGLANSVEKLGKSMQVVNSVKTSDFARLTRNIEKLSTINTATLNSSASAINILSKSVSSLGNVSQNAQQIGTLASNLSKLGYKSIATATQNIPQLANALKQLMVTLSTAPRVNYNIVQMTNALANLAGQLKGVKSTTTTSNTWFGNLSRSMNRATRSSFSLAAAFGKFYATYFLVIRAIKGLWKSVEGTADYIEAFNYFNVAFGKIASEWKDDWQKYGYQNADAYAESFTKRMQESMAKLSGVKVEIDENGLGLLTSSGMKNLGLNIQEITQYASQLASVTNSLGQTGETSLAIADSFTKLAGDISSLFNVDFETVSKNLQSGLIGQSRALYKYGIDITNATLQTYAYELGLEKTVAEMTQMEKQQLRVLAILDQSKVSWGDLANTINSPSNMIRQLTNNLKEAGMVLGQLFMPALEKILPVLNGFSIAIKQLLVDFAGIMGITINFDAFGQGYSELEEELDGLEEGLEDATESAKKLKSALRGFDKLNVISTSTSGLSSSLNASFDLTEQIKKSTEEYNKQWQQAFDKMENQAQSVANKISAIFSEMAKTLNLSEISKEIEKFAIRIDWGTIGEGLYGTLELVNQVVSELSESFTNIFSNVSPRLAEAINNASEAFVALLDILNPLWNFISTNLLPVFEDLSSVFLENALIDFNVWVENFKADMQDTVDFVNNVLSGEWDKAWENIKTNFDTKLDNIVKSLKDHWEAMKNFLGVNDLLETIKTHFAQDKINAALSGIGEAFKSVWKNALNGVIDLFNSFISTINTALTINFPDMEIWGKKYGGGTVQLIDIPKIPKFATGGFPEDGWFRASKGEYFGSFDDGTSVIANNNQIVSGIANGVRDANAEQNALLREEISLLRQILAKDTSISSRDIFNAVRTEDRNYSLRNGQSAFGY